jgi:hypothetical protein
MSQVTQSARLPVDCLGNVVEPSRGGVFIDSSIWQLQAKIKQQEALEEKRRQLLHLYKCTLYVHTADILDADADEDFRLRHELRDPESLMNPVSDTWFDNETPYSGESDKNDTPHYGDEASRYLSFDGYDGEIDPDMAFYQADNDHHRGLRLARKDRKRPLNPAIFH